MVTESKLKLVINELNETRPDGYRDTVASLQQALAHLNNAEALYRQADVAHMGKPTCEWYTPADIVDRARTVMGGIDLDPASCELANLTVKADKFFTQDDDGLAHKWYGKVWCNPPYGKIAPRFVNRAIDHYRAKEIEQAILLLNRTGAAWYLTRIEEVSAICRVHRRIAFHDVNGELCKSPRYYNDLLYLGPDPQRFAAAFRQYGRITFND